MFCRFLNVFFEGYNPLQTKHFLPESPYLLDKFSLSNKFFSNLVLIVPSKQYVRILNILSKHKWFGAHKNKPGNITL